MNKKLIDALEICLQALDNGETIDATLKRFPALADELRPILEASLHAKSMAGEAVAEDVHRRGRARVLQRAAEFRESKRAPRKRTWIFAFRPVAVTLMLVVFLLSGTGLVRASTTSLPGDNLYPVKRTWEDFTLVFTSGMKREELELTYETERVEEINELLAEGRGEVVTFSGYVNTQTPSQWTVAGVPVLITSDTVLPAQPVTVGSGVTVSGTTNELGFLVAQNVEIVPAGTVIPDLDDDAGENSSGEEEDHENENSSVQNPLANGDSANPSGDDANESDQESKNPETKLKGVLETTNGKLWVVNGQNVDVSHAEIVGSPAAGAVVTIEGFYDANGIFVATKVVFSSGGEGDSSDDSDGGSNLSNDKDSNDNDDDDEENDNDSNDNGDDDNNNNDGGDNDNGGDD